MAKQTLIRAAQELGAIIARELFTEGYGRAIAHRLVMEHVTSRGVAVTGSAGWSEQAVAGRVAEIILGRELNIAASSREFGPFFMDLDRKEAAKQLRAVYVAHDPLHFLPPTEWWRRVSLRKERRHVDAVKADKILKQMQALWLGSSRVWTGESSKKYHRLETRMRKLLGLVVGMRQK